jgi:hypothetical protein
VESIVEHSVLGFDAMQLPDYPEQFFNIGHAAASTHRRNSGRDKRRKLYGVVLTFVLRYHHWTPKSFSSL